MNDRQRLPRRTAASIAVIAFALGLAAAAFPPGHDAGARADALWSPSKVDLVLEGESGSVDAFLSGDNLAPGDRVRGSLRLYHATDQPPDSLDLDVGTRFDDDAGGLADAFQFSHLSYGRDDLLSSVDGGRNVRAELDANRDGRLSLREFALGVPDLPTPQRQADGGTPIVMELEVDPRAQKLDSGRVSLTFSFYLGDVAASDYS